MEPVKLVVSEVRRSFQPGLSLASSFLSEAEIAWDWYCLCGAKNIATDIPTVRFENLPKGVLPYKMWCEACGQSFTSEEEPNINSKLFVRK
jgi:hypothetical protein